MGKKGLLKFWGNMLGKESSTPKQAPSTTQKEEKPKVNPKPPSLFDSEEERAAVYEKVRKQLAEEAARENETYDPNNDPEVSKLLQMLSEVERSEFFKVRERSAKSCADNEVLSQRELDILNLKAMVKSAEYKAVSRKRDSSVQDDLVRYCQNYSAFCAISLDEAALLREEHPEWSKHQIVRSILEQQGQKHLSAKNYGLYRNALFGISETYRHESIEGLQKHYLLQCCYMDANGYANNGMVEDRLAMLAPGLVAQLRHIYKDDIKPFGEDYQNAVKSLPLPRFMEYEIRAFGMIRQALLEQYAH